MIRKRGNSYQADVTIEGRRIRKQFSSWAEAKAWEDSFNPGGSSSSHDAYASEGLSSYAKRIIPLIWEDNDWAANVRYNINEAISVVGDIPVSSFSDEHVEKLLSFYKKNGNSNGTINRKFASLSKLFRHAHRTRVIREMPFFPRQKEAIGRIRYLTYEEEDALFHWLRQLNEDHYHLVVFLVDTGARFGEALKLQKRDVDPVARTVTFWETKSGGNRTVYLTTRALEALRLDQCEGVRPFGMINRFTFRDHWAKAKEYSGLGEDKLVVPHVLRHTCASRLVQGGEDIRRVQEWMGHKSLQMTMRYAHLAPKSLQSCVNVLERGSGGRVDAAVSKTAP